MEDGSEGGLVLGRARSCAAHTFHFDLALVAPAVRDARAAARLSMGGARCSD